MRPEMRDAKCERSECNRRRDDPADPRRPLRTEMDRARTRTRDNRFELELHIVRALPAFVRLFAQTDRHHSFERRGRGRHQRRHRLRIAIDDCGDEARLRPAFERALPRHHLVKQRAEREHVRPCIRFNSFELFRRHVLQRPDDRPLGRQRLLLGRHHDRSRPAEDAARCRKRMFR